MIHHPHVMHRVFACFLLSLGILFSFSNCRDAPNAKETSTAEIGSLTFPMELSEQISGAKAFQQLEKIIEFSPRHPGSDGHAATLDYLEKVLTELGWDCRQQIFRAATPEGPHIFTNLLARHKSAVAAPTSLPILLAGHFDTKKFSFPFQGANDGGSSTALLLELARVLATNSEAAAQVELVFFDGEESLHRNITQSDGLYGSKHFAYQLKQRDSLPGLAIVVDLVGDPSLPMYWNSDAAKNHIKAISELSKSLPFSSAVKESPGMIIDDHVPLQQAGVPSLLLIGDFSAMSYWHTAEDTLQNIKPEMLENVGKLVLQFLSQLREMENN